MYFRRLALYGAFFGCVLSMPLYARAATLYIDPFTQDVFKGDTVTLTVRLDVDEGECVNTVDAVVSYSETIQAIDVSRGKSILTLWIEEPTLDTNARRITFAGGIPNGYCGRIPGDPSLTTVVAEIVVRAPGFSVGRPDDVAALIQFEPGTRVLLNDGSGTEASLRLLGGTVNLIQDVGTTSVNAWGEVVSNDDIPPQEFSLELVQNPQVFGGKYYIVFNTTDKQSGMDHYEVLEEPAEDYYGFSWGRVDAPWTRVDSPYVLKDQSLRSIIRVRAIDKAGNERMSVLIPDDSLRRLPPLAFVALSVGAIIGVVLVGVFTLFVMRKRKVRREGVHDETYEE